MRKIFLILKNNIVEKIDYEKMTSGTYKHDICTFSFDSSWDGLEDRYAVFVTNEKAYKKTLIDNECEIPIEISQNPGGFGIGVYAQKIVDNEIVDVRESSEVAYISYYEGAYRNGLEETGALANSSEYEQYIYKMNAIYENVKAEHINTIESINNKEADAKLEITRHTNLKIEEYNNNTAEKIKKFNDNYENKKSEIDSVAKNVTEDKSAVSKMKNAVETLEQSARTSEENAQEYLEEVKSISQSMSFATFEVDVESGELYINSPEKFGNMGFSINNDGNLEVEIDG